MNKLHRLPSGEWLNLADVKSIRLPVFLDGAQAHYSVSVNANGSIFQINNLTRDEAQSAADALAEAVNAAREPKADQELLEALRELLEVVELGASTNTACERAAAAITRATGGGA